jgi:hypothetical protein
VNDVDAECERPQKGKFSYLRVVELVYLRVDDHLTQEEEQEGRGGRK